MTRDLTEAELLELAAAGASAWARRALDIRHRLKKAIETDQPSEDLLADVESVGRELRNAAVGATPELIAQLGRIRGEMMAYAVEVRRRMLANA